MKLLLIILYMAIIGCEEQEQQAKAPEPTVFKSQLEALDKAKQVEGMLQNAADLQQQKINDSIKQSGQ